MSFSYSVRVNVDKELPPVSSGDYDVDFCSTGVSAQTPPKLQVSLAAFSTAPVAGVIAECYTVGTTDQTLLSFSPFATAQGRYVYLRESSGNTAADLLVSSTDTTLAMSTPFSKMVSSSVAFFERHTAGSVIARAFSTSSTGTIQVLCIGE